MTTTAPTQRRGPDFTPGSLLAVWWTLAMTAAVLWPFMTHGELLLRDMVVPEVLPLTDAALGLGDSPARAVPQDAILALIGTALNTPTVVTGLLFTAFMIGGVSASELARRLLGAGPAGQIAAVTMTIWTPYAVERLLQGHWSVVIAAVLLPAIALASVTHRPGWRASAMAVAGLTPTGALLAGIAALTAARDLRDRLLAGLTTALISAPWLIATAVSHSPVTSDASGAAAFAPRAEHLTGTIGALAGLGGIWNSDVVPASRETGASALLVLGLLGLFLLGARRAWRWGWHGGITAEEASLLHARRRLIMVAPLVVVLTAALATPWGIAAMESALVSVPGAGLLRDGQKWVALAIPGYGLLAAAGAEAMAALLPDRRRFLAGGVAALMVMVAVPELPTAVAPLRPQQSWSGWQWVAGIVALDDDALVPLPAASYRIINGRPVYDPATKRLPAPVLASAELNVGGELVDAADARAAAARSALLRADDDAVATLAELGVGWVLVQDSPGPMGAAETVLAQLDEVHRDERLRLYHVPGPITQLPRPDRSPAWVGLALWAAMLLAGPVAAALRALLRRPAG
ncbi:hypothetical protein KRX51_08950 [Corynebacterium sp. TAE3-ERU12]|uniref:hypothetical protein n=1 Tax=Corynebacterium sp. TAE3-ERU12 TaxID=2849491 RepID=UPI001C48E5DE|nr:hypothetical protein [Corynebacterium sp. TAE3-ERU12]MBV7296036.1 hypothetical protein [Corynebacterium sp. TAE3-ERU12]